MVEYEQIIRGLNIKPPIGFFGYSSVTLIKDGDENILCDTGGYGVRKCILELKDRVKIHKVFLSHLHFDHCANVSLFKNIPIYIHKDEVDELDKNADNIYSDMDSFIKKSIKYLNIILFSKEDKLSENTKIKFTPGHTKGHSSLEIINQQNKIIITGDAIETYQEYLSPNQTADCFNIGQYLNSHKLIKDQCQTIILGHGSVIENGKLVDSNPELKTF